MAAVPQAVKGYHAVVELDPEVHQYLATALGEERLQGLLASMTKPPLDLCMRVNTLRITPADAIAELKASLTADDAVALGGREPFEHPVLQNVICIPGTGPNNLDFNVPELKEVVVTRKAGESMLRGAHAFAPGVLAVSKGLEPGDHVAVSIAREVPGNNGKGFGMTRGWGIEAGTDPAAGPGLDRTGYYIGIGTARMSRREIWKASSGVAVTLQQRVYNIPGCHGVLHGKGTLQNLPSAVVATVLAPQPGERVLDMCAAPGGKTCAIAELMRNEGEVIALDRSYDKVANVRSMAAELGHTCIQGTKKDSTRLLKLSAEFKARRAQALIEGGDAGQAKRQRGPTVPMSANEIARRQRRAARAAQHGMVEPRNNAVPSHAAAAGMTVHAPDPDPYPGGFECESFDRVLLDGPCSALGLRPRLTVRTTLRELEQAAMYQRLMLREAVHLAKVGGTIVFSTCTLNPLENEANVRWLLDRYPQLRLVGQAPRLGGPGVTGSAEVRRADGAGTRTETWLTDAEAALVQRFDAHTGADTNAFFIAKFEKEQSVPEEDAVLEVPGVLGIRQAMNPVLELHQWELHN